MSLQRGAQLMCCGLASLALVAGTADAGQDAADRAPRLVINGPPPPQPPDVIARDANGRATMRAIRLVEPLRVDGALDERVYQDVPAVSDFIQTEPVEGALATEKSEVWVLFDDEHFYISFRCWAENPDIELVANDMRRDSFGVASGEFVDLIFDTFYDHRNSVNLTVNPIGGRMDGQITDERDYFGDWNPIWDVRTGRFDGGWTFEAAIPFKSLRYRPGRTQVWGINLARHVKNAEKNEISYLVPIPHGLSIMQTSLAATLVGLEVPEAGPVIDVKPYAIADVATDRRASPPLSNELGGDIGIDVKYGITQNLVADLTVNTDFAQVEADEEQVNLTRFSLFFPEKREFFLENQGLFTFGGTTVTPFGNLNTLGDDNTPVVFYSRRIGLQDGVEVPMHAGGRLTGRVGKLSIGVLNVQTGSEPSVAAKSTNFSVVRVKQDILRRSSIGAIFTGRSVSTRSPGSNQAYGVDGTFAFYDNLNINTYWARTQTAELGADEDSYRGQLDYNGDRYGVKLERLVGRPGLQSRSRLSPPRRFRAKLRLGEVQPPAPFGGGHPPAILGRGVRLHHEPCERPRDPPRGGPVCHLVRERRPVRCGLHGLLRVPGRAVSDRPPGDHPGRRLQLPGRANVVCTRDTAAISGGSDLPARRLLWR